MLTKRTGSKNAPVRSRGCSAPVYLTRGRSGPDHRPVFTVAVRIEGLGEAEGEGRSKQEAQRRAAQALLEKEHGDER